MRRTIAVTAMIAGLLAAGAAPALAAEPSARCGDGTVSYSATRSGTCSRHGGVAEWLAGAPAKRSARPTAPATAAPAPGGWDCRTSGNNVCGPGQPWAAGYYVIAPDGTPYLVSPWATAA